MESELSFLCLRGCLLRSFWNQAILFLKFVLSLNSVVEDESRRLYAFACAAPTPLEDGIERIFEERRTPVSCARKIQDLEV